MPATGTEPESPGTYDHPVFNNSNVLPTAPEYGTYGNDDYDSWESYYTHRAEDEWAQYRCQTFITSSCLFPSKVELATDPNYMIMAHNV